MAQTSARMDIARVSHTRVPPGSAGHTQCGGISFQRRPAKYWLTYLAESKPSRAREMKTSVDKAGMTSSHLTPYPQYNIPKLCVPNIHRQRDRQHEIVMRTLPRPARRPSNT